MLERVFALVGIPALVQGVRAQWNRLIERAGDRIRADARSYGIIAALGLSGAAMAFVTIVGLIIAAVVLVDRSWGIHAALAALVVIPGAATAVLSTLIYSRLSKKRPAQAPATPGNMNTDRAHQSYERSDDPTTPRGSAAGAGSTGGELRQMLEGAFGEFLTAPRNTGTPIDRLLRRITSEAAASSDRTVGLAIDVVSSGSRKAVFGILAGTVALGWFLAKRPAAIDER